MSDKKFIKKYPPFPQPYLEQIARVFGETYGGLTGAEIGHALSSCKITDIDPTNTKWKRLYNAFVEFQNQHQVGNHVIMFIHHVMNPVSYTNYPDLFNMRKDRLNRILAFYGMELQNNGKLKYVSQANDLDDAIQRAAKLKNILEQRKVHTKVLDHCRGEVLQDNYFHAVLEAMKSITSRIRLLSGLDGDGAKLVGQAFGGENPMLKINSFDTESKRGEQRGFVNLLNGLYGMVRNPTAHESKIEWEMTEQDAIDILTTISLIHRKIENCDQQTQNKNYMMDSRQNIS